MRVSGGKLADLPEDRCVSVGAGEAMVARVGQSVVAFENRCLHQESPLSGGYIKDGVLTCPLHFWRYRLPEGAHVGTDARLPNLPVEVIDGEVFVDLPEPKPAMTMREQLLAHAAEWNRDEQ